MLSGIDFEAAGSSVVHYCLSNYLLRGHQVAVKHDMGALSGLNAKHLRECPPPSLVDL